MIPSGLRCCLGQRMVLLRPRRTTADPRYLLYALQSESVQQEIRSHDGTGSTVSNLRISLLENLQIPVNGLRKAASMTSWSYWPDLGVHRGGAPAWWSILRRGPA